LLVLSLIALGDWMTAALVVCAGSVLRAVQPSVVFDVSATALCRSRTLEGLPIAPARVLAWASVEVIATRWRRPREFTERETVVTDRVGESIRFGTSMGLGPYRALVEDIVSHAPHARREGLTGQVLAEAPRPPRRRWR
jgi:hypothetical protein